MILYIKIFIKKNFKKLSKNSPKIINYLVLTKISTGGWLSGRRGSYHQNSSTNI